MATTPKRKISAATLAKLQETPAPAVKAPAKAKTVKAPAAPKLNAQQVLLAEFKAKAIALTVEARKVTVASLATPKETDVKAIAIAKSVSAMGNLCSGAKRDVANLMNTVTGLNVRAAYDGLNGVIPSLVVSAHFKPGTIIVPMRNPNSHSYELNKPCIYLGSSAALRMDGTIGNNLCEAFADSGKTQNIRAANEAETEAVFSYLNCMATQQFISDTAIRHMKAIK